MSPGKFCFSHKSDVHSRVWPILAWILGAASLHLNSYTFLRWVELPRISLRNPNALFLPALVSVENKPPEYFQAQVLLNWKYFFFPCCPSQTLSPSRVGARENRPGATWLLQKLSASNFCLFSEERQALILLCLNSVTFTELALPMTLSQRNLWALPRDICAHKHLDEVTCVKHKGTARWFAQH